jgi:hypothetical protein
LGASAQAQSADWQSGVWHEPQVRYLLADMTLGGNVQLYRDYAAKERDPDSREAIRLWDNGARVVNTNEFERRWISNPFGKDGRVMRVVQRGTERTISGREVFLTSDLGLDKARIRVVLACLSLGRSPNRYKTTDASTTEAMRQWNTGVRVSNTNWFQLSGEDAVVYRGTTISIDGAQVRLNTDPAFSEANVRYFLADMFLGGSRDFYHRAAESAHETGCEEAVSRFDHAVKITNLDEFERKKVAGQTVITRKGSNDRISGFAVKLSSDL